MGRGRTPDSEEAKVLRGTWRPDRAAPARPQASPELPTAPEWLPARAAELFDLLVERLEEIGVASATYTEMLALAANALADVELYTATLEQPVLAPAAGEGDEPRQLAP